MSPLPSVFFLSFHFCPDEDVSCYSAAFTVTAFVDRGFKQVSLSDYVGQW